MNATGLFFLTARPALVLLISPEGGAARRGWQFSTVERTRRGVQRVIAVWEGVEAATFVEVHARCLVKGCALNLQLERVRPAPDRDGLAAAINACSLAPERWPSYHADLPVDPPSQPRPLAA